MTAQIYKGKALSPGLGQGETFVNRDILQQADEFYEIEDDEVEKELTRFEDAVVHIARELDTLADQVEEELDSDISGVFHAHSAIVQDGSLKTEVKGEIKKELVSAGSAVKTVYRRWERRFRAMEAEVSRQKADDMRDLARRMIASLSGIRTHALENLPEGSVLVAKRLLPSEAIILGRRKAAAAILEEGGAGSHAALFAREMGLPIIAGIPDLVKKTESGSMALVDAGSGEIIIDPEQRQLADFEQKKALYERATAQARQNAHKPTVTQDGHAVTVLANVGNPEDAKMAIENGAEGIGLYRIERVYLGKPAPPGANYLLNEMRATLEAAKGLPVCVRLLDVGADKPLPYVDMENELNPSLGLRGIRFLLKHSDLLTTQLKALLRLSADFDVQILVPMVTFPEDMQRIGILLAELAGELKVESIPKLGAMIETPAAALAAADIARHADFLSFGTNDLTQYIFAADRDNVSVDAYFDDAHPSIFRLLNMVHKDVPNIPLSLCGELAGRSEQILKILQCGISTISVAPPLIPFIKEAIRELNLLQ